MIQFNKFFSCFYFNFCCNTNESLPVIEKIPYQDTYKEWYLSKKNDYFLNNPQRTNDNINYEYSSLFEYTPRGNIILKYDPKQEQFYYYCDSKDISFVLLENVARKFVIIFQCFEIFKEIEKQLSEVEEIKSLLKQKYKDKVNDQKLKELQDKITKQDINKYIYKGKLSDYYFINKPNENNSSTLSYQEYLKLVTK